jgi:hypothetical protein
MSVPRYHLSAVSFGKVVVALSGYNDGQSAAWASTEAADIESGRLETFEAEPAMREGAVAAWGNGRL